jgi:phosphatidylethanolamine-binding protein (PEBP) family uncharacterized protein
MRTGSVMLPVLALLSLLALSGCGGGDDSSSTAESNETTTSVEAEKGNEGEKQGGPAIDQDGGQGNSPSGAKQGPDVSQPNGEEESGITPEQKREATTANVTLESPSFKQGAALPARYTCDGKNGWPALNWSGIPPEAGELALLVLSVDPEEQKLLFDWAVGGLDPSLTSIEEGKLPPGAVVGENSFGKDGYEVCPKSGTAQSYIFMLFAIPKALDPKPGFDARRFREEVLAEHGNVGLLSAPYKR